MAGPLVTLFLLLALAGGRAAWSRPAGLTRPVAVATTALSPASAPPAPTSPVGPLPPASAPPSTIPLTTKGQSSHVSPAFAILSGVGAAVVVLILATQCALTRPGRRRQWTL
jgi:hypothetical protein